MVIEIWSDFVCPYCYMGQISFDQALNEFEHRDKIRVIHKSFELDPEVNHALNETVPFVLMNKYGLNIEDINQENIALVKQASTLGLSFNHLDSLRDTNTFNAHRILQYAKVQGLDDRWIKRLMKAHFTEGLFIGDPEILISLAKEIGLNPNMIKTILSSSLYQKNVRDDQYEAVNIGIETVPYYIFNKEFVASGALTKSEFTDILKQVWLSEA